MRLPTKQIYVALNENQIERLQELRGAYGGTISEIMRNLVDFGFLNIEKIYKHRVPAQQEKEVG